MFSSQPGEFQIQASSPPNVDASPSLYAEFLDEMNDDRSSADFITFTALTSDPDDPRQLGDPARVRREIEELRQARELRIQIMRGTAPASEQERQEALEHLAHDAVPAIRMEVARNTLTPPAALARLANDAVPGIRLEVAGHPLTPPAALARLANDAAPGIRLVVAGRASTPPAALERLYRDSDPYVRLAVFNKHPEMHATFARNADPAIRLELARHLLGTKTPSPDTLAILALDQDPRVRAAVAENRRTRPQDLVRLSQDPDATVRRTVAANEAAPNGVLLALSTDRDASVRGSVGSNEAASHGILLALSRDEDVSVRRTVAANRSATNEILLTLSTDQDLMVRKNVAVNRATPEAVLMNLARDNDWRVRRALLERPDSGSLPRELLFMLARDPREEVHRTANDLLVRIERKRLGMEPTPAGPARRDK